MKNIYFKIFSLVIILLIYSCEKELSIMDSENPVDVPVGDLQADFIGENPLKVKADTGGYIVKLDANPLVNEEYGEVLSQIKSLSGKEEILILLKEEVVDMPDGMPEELRQKLSQIKTYKGNIKGTEVPVELKVIQLPSITRYKMTLYSSDADKEYVIESYELDEREIPKEASEMRKNAMSHIKKGNASYRSSRLKEGKNNAVFHFEASQGSISSQGGCGSSDLQAAPSSTDPAPYVSARRDAKDCQFRGYYRLPVNLWINKHNRDLRDRSHEFVRDYMQTFAIEKTSALHNYFRNSGYYLSYGLDEFKVVPIVFSGYEVDSELFWRLHNMERVYNSHIQIYKVEEIANSANLSSSRPELGSRHNGLIFGGRWLNVLGTAFEGRVSETKCGGLKRNNFFVSSNDDRTIAHELGHTLGLQHGDGMSYSLRKTIMFEHSFLSVLADAGHYSDRSGKKMRQTVVYGHFNYNPPEAPPCTPFSMGLYYRYYNTREPITSCRELKNVLSRFNVELRDQVTLCSYSEEAICERFGLIDDPFDWFRGFVEIYKNENNQVVIEYTARFDPQSGFPDDIDRYYVDGMATWSSPTNQGRVNALFYEAQPPRAREFLVKRITIPDPHVRLEWPIIASVQFRYRRNGIWHTREFGRRSVVLGY